MIFVKAFILKASIKLQLLMAYIMLTLPLLLLGFSSYSTHKDFNQATVNANAQANILMLTTLLQHDVIDLQRNAFIYKDSASHSAAKKITALHIRLDTTLKKLQAIESLHSHHENLNSMKNHLNDYKINFNTVVDNRTRLEVLVKKYISNTPEALALKTQALSLSASQKQTIKNLLEQAQSHSLSYLLNNYQTHLTHFKKNISEAIKILKINNQKTILIDQINSHQKDFLNIVNLKRNYTYLISVVMAGSAREILYFSDTLSELSKKTSKSQQKRTTDKVNNQKNIIFYAVTFGIFMALITPLYFFWLIIKPIQKITHVLTELSKGKDIERIPGLERGDEIGLLAKSADIFKAKNEQTTDLLQQAENSITVQQKLNKELSEAKHQAEKSLSVKSDFLANMSHELRTPLNSVIGYTVRLLKKTDDFNTRQISSLNAIERNGKHLLAMINDILDLSKIEADKLELRFENFVLHNLCENVIDQLQASYEAKNLEFIFEFSPPKDFIVTSDPIRLSQVLINLISNAIKYTEQGWVKLSISQPDSQYIKFIISDSGIGIKKEDMHRLFKRFEQLDSDTRFHIGHGTGLGLAIVDNVSRLLGASVSASSEYNQGSSFTVILPITNLASST